MPCCLLLTAAEDSYRRPFYLSCLFIFTQITVYMKKQKYENVFCKKKQKTVYWHKVHSYTLLNTTYITKLPNSGPLLEWAVFNEYHVSNVKHIVLIYLL